MRADQAVSVLLTIHEANTKFIVDNDMASSTTFAKVDRREYNARGRLHWRRHLAILADTTLSFVPSWITRTSPSYALHTGTRPFIQS